MFFINVIVIDIYCKIVQIDELKFLLERNKFRGLYKSTALGPSIENFYKLNKIHSFIQKLKKEKQSLNFSLFVRIF